MDNSSTPVYVFNGSDDNNLFVPSTQVKGKQKAVYGLDTESSSGMYDPLSSITDHAGSALPSSSSLGRFTGATDSDSTLSAPTRFHLRSIVPGNTEYNKDDVSDQSLYQSVVPDTRKPHPQTGDEMDMDVDEPVDAVDNLDLARYIKGLYRMLDLISEQGSGGLVDKVIISQDSLKTFINTICPGAYGSLTKVNFKALDQSIIKPIGIYGSKEEIVRFLLNLRVIDDAVAAQLLADPDSHGLTNPTLRSGLYVLHHSADHHCTGEQVFLVYWPEHTTWDDSAQSQVRRNRVTFMRYLMKMCDQVVALMSSEHAQSIVWNDGDEDEDGIRDEDDEGGRIITCVVDRTKEQGECVQVRQGFKAMSEHIFFAESAIEHSPKQASTKPSLLYGETDQGFLTVEHLSNKVATDTYRARPFTLVQLEHFLLSDRLILNESLDQKACKAIVDAGLKKRFPTECSTWEHEVSAVEAQRQGIETEELKEVKERIQREADGLGGVIHEALVNRIIQLYPFLEVKSFPYPGPSLSAAPFSEIAAIHPQANDAFLREMESLTRIHCPKFRCIKDRLCFSVEVASRLKNLDKGKLHLIINAAATGNLEATEAAIKDASPPPRTFNRWTNFIRKAIWLRPPDDKSAHVEQLLREAHAAALGIPDTYFFSEIVNNMMFSENSALMLSIEEAREASQTHLEIAIPRSVRKLVGNVKAIQEDACTAKVKADVASREHQEQRRLRLQLIHHINDSTEKVQSLHTLRIDSVEKDRGCAWSSSQYKIVGARETQEDPMTCYTIHTLGLTEQDKHSLQMDPTVIPSPRFRLQHKFRLLYGNSVIRAQLLQGERLLLVVADRIGNLSVYLDGLTAIGTAVARGRGKALNREKIGQDFILAFDESKRMLSVVSCNKLLLHMFIHDDARGFQAQGSSINLNAWYAEGRSIRHACFVSGSEELLLVDSQAHARIYSLVTMQFRPATLNLREMPHSVHSTPDGSCLLVSHAQGSNLVVTAYHWSSFGSTEGIVLNIPDLLAEEPFTVTSLITKTAVHLVKLDLSLRCCQSYALDITRRVTEWMFRERLSRATSGRDTNTTAHNCLVDCHSEVWTRFPVFAAVQRETISSASLRNPRTLVFVTDRDYDMFAPHFSDMIHAFERSAKKPTGDVLKSIKVLAISFPVFAKELYSEKAWNVSQYRTGEWIVDFLCLIPIQIAVAKENRFIPLKDGVYSTELERSLLGAEVNRIVDNISFGWYESLFQSYMATKPVRVVSSMGEQSVGKSYALNHLVDTSFAGSAMRTTEGVWMSVTPTQKELIVALDFEGVHSIERSAQEDTLLVLFNTAISNLVLFRNNFALSRDIAGLFQSFQSSATVLDPAANPSLFQSTLVIIIKDVVEADRAEIAREFSLKFQRIVQDEQEANFISCLHAGKLNIIPWPVIESKEFYKLFPSLKRSLDKQVLTHHAAGEFLHKMKTLMAKLKANDWAAMSQTMASHRAQLLSMMLPNALAFGFQEVDPQQEVLKNIDTDLPVELPDTLAQLFLADGTAPHLEARERALTILRATWKHFDARQHMPDSEWTGGLSKYLEDIVNLRIDHIQEWLTQNLSRFQAGHASIEELRRTFDGATVDLKSNVQLCKLQCANCQLFCVQSRFHDGRHDCQTDHSCIHKCDFCHDGTGELRECTMNAGHVGKHICRVTAHLCGKACKFAGRFGCLTECVKVADHTDDEHLCAAPVHSCAKPCDLSSIKLHDGSDYSCPGFCRIPSDVPHVRHECEARLCSITCQLCKRLCANADHMHGLQDGEIHLCGQEHLCAALCTSQGICEIETAPYSIEATFSGRHETFQYTKYSQVAKRLKCIKPIRPGATKHKGSHKHSLDKQVIHFCEARCENCGYFCTLPLGHPQQEHETRHGSMSRTRWTIDGPDDDDAFEIEGRKFSTNDEGAPMMCNLVCQTMGRHVHIDYCRADDEAACTGNDEIQHIVKQLLPNPDRPKDSITHNLFWKRSGFKDPYSREEQAVFAKCDAMCSGPEHAGDAGNVPQPSYCTLPIFHPPSDLNVAAPAMGYISHDGHHFSCRNPVVMQQAFHVIFVADRSSSMWCTDRHPLPNTPASDRISAHSDNRFGAVLSSLFSFWTARAAAIASGVHAGHRDAYSIVLFNHDAMIALENDFTSTPDDLLDALLVHDAEGWTNFTEAIDLTQRVMENNWSTERSPVVIFLSDGECHIADEKMQDFCRASVQLGKAVSFHAVSFGPDSSSLYLRRMAEIAQDAQNNAPRDPLAPAAATVISSYTQALDTVQLAETFLGIAESLRKPRGALMH